MKHVRVPVLCALALLSACHRDSDAPAKAAAAQRIAAPVSVKQGPTVAEQTSGMVEAATLGKSAVPVLVKFDLQQKPQIGVPLEINFAVLPQIDAGPVAIQVSGSEGLELSGVAPRIELPSVESGGVYRQMVKVTPLTDGVLLLGLAVALRHDEITESRAFTVPLIVDR